MGAKQIRLISGKFINVKVAKNEDEHTINGKINWIGHTLRKNNTLRQEEKKFSWVTSKKIKQESTTEEADRQPLREHLASIGNTRGKKI